MSLDDAPAGRAETTPVETHRGGFGEFGGETAGLIERTFRERIVLVGVDRGDGGDVEAHLDELSRLVDTAGADEVAREVQRRSAPDPATYVGRGKADELRRLADSLDADTVVFDDELSPAQQRNLEGILERTALDRTAVILDIFAQNARTDRGQGPGRAGPAPPPPPPAPGSGHARPRPRQAGAMGAGGARAPDRVPRPGRDPARGGPPAPPSAHEPSLERRLEGPAPEVRPDPGQRAGPTPQPGTAPLSHRRLHQRRQVDRCSTRLTDAGVARRGPPVRHPRPHQVRRLDLAGRRGRCSLSDTVGFVRKLPHQARRGVHARPWRIVTEVRPARPRGRRLRPRSGRRPDATPCAASSPTSVPTTSPSSWRHQQGRRRSRRRPSPWLAVTMPARWRCRPLTGAGRRRAPGLAPGRPPTCPGARARWSMVVPYGQGRRGGCRSIATARCWSRRPTKPRPPASGPASTPPAHLPLRRVPWSTDARRGGYYGRRRWRPRFVPPIYPFERLATASRPGWRAPIDGGMVDLSIGNTGRPAAPRAVVEALADASGTERGYPASIGSAVAAARRQRRGSSVAWGSTSTSPPAPSPPRIGTKELVAGLPHWLRLRDTGARHRPVPGGEPTRPTRWGRSSPGAERCPSPSTTRWRLDRRRPSPPPTPSGRCACGSNTPGNPAGGLDDLDAVAAWGRSHGSTGRGVRRVLRRIHLGRPPTLGASRAAGTDGMIVAVHSLSKRSNLAGVRVGFYAGDAGSSCTYLSGAA